ncbi:MAG TPA: flagellar FlbD family protein [Clostridiales bacterium]|jgi:flagellar protein FlbD|nr:flagellar FlbD family protein [Clostridiales bacterium]
MIELTKLNKKKFYLNADLIETIESTPDTVITLRNGKLVLVEETPEQIVEEVIAYKRKLLIP